MIDCIIEPFIGNGCVFENDGFLVREVTGGMENDVGQIQGVFLFLRLHAVCDPIPKNGNG